MRLDRESLFAERRQACTGGIWFWSSVDEQAARSRRVCPLQQWVSSDTPKGVSGIPRNEKKWYHGHLARLLCRIEDGRLFFTGDDPHEKEENHKHHAFHFRWSVAWYLFGLFMPGRYEFLLPVIQLIGSLYMNALRMMIYPLVFCSLIVGIQGIGSVGATGKIGGQAVLYFAGTTLFASILGLFLPQLLDLGKGVEIQMVESSVEAAKFTSLMDTVKNLIPANPVAAFANGEMLQVLAFAVIMGIACLVLGAKAEPVVKLCHDLSAL